MSPAIHSTSCVFQSPYSFPRGAEMTEDLVIMFTLYLPLAVFSFSVKLSSFTLVSKAEIILYFSHLCNRFFQENIRVNLTFALPFAVNAALNLPTI